MIGLIGLFLLAMAPLKTVEANAGPPANIQLNVIHDGIDYAIDFLIEPSSPVTSEDHQQALRRITEHELGFDFSLDYFEEDAFPKELVTFVSDQGFVSNTLYGSQDYAFFIPTQSSFNDQYVLYFRVPRVFQMALVSEGIVYTSDVITMTQFDFEITWDVRGLDAEVTESVGIVTGLNNHPLTRSTTYLQFFFRLFITLAIELLVLFLWGFRKTSTWIKVTLLNIITQSLLTLGTLYVFFITPNNGIWNAIFLFILGEIFVFMVEIFFASFFINEKSLTSRITFALFANIASLIAGFFLMIALFNL
jgi:hypothetical protein